MKLDEIRTQAANAVSELSDIAHLEAGDIVVIGCSSSEAGGSRIGTNSAEEIAAAIFDGIYPILKEKKIWWPLSAASI